MPTRRIYPTTNSPLCQEAEGLRARSATLRQLSAEIVAVNRLRAAQATHQVSAARVSLTQAMQLRADAWATYQRVLPPAAD